LGASVSLSSDGHVIAIGATTGFNDVNVQSGHASVFEYDATGWSQLGSAISGENLNDYFGVQISLSSDGRTVAVGAVYHDTNYGIDAGYVRVFSFDDSDWTQAGSDIEGKAEGSHFGRLSLELSSDGKTLAASGFGGHLKYGMVRVYNYQEPPTSPPTPAPVSKDMTEYINAASKAIQITANYWKCVLFRGRQRWRDYL